jgi:arylamine N-acetyltransferase
MEPTLGHLPVLEHFRERGSIISMRSHADLSNQDTTLRLFLKHFGLDLHTPPETLLRQVVAAFARLPYENLTKIIKEETLGRTAEARRGPEEVIADHMALGTGGTCFSLTEALLHLLRSLGWQAEPILADRPYGADTHCALLVWIEGQPHLLDPGYLLTEPVPLSRNGEQRIATPFQEVLLTPRAGGTKLDLHTIYQGRSTLRMTFKTAPVDKAKFLKVWDASFDWDMMRYPLLTRVAEGQHFYLHGNRFQTRSRDAVCRTEVAPDNLAAQIAELFRIDVGVTTQALNILHRKGERYGHTSPA